MTDEIERPVWTVPIMCSTLVRFRALIVRIIFWERMLAGATITAYLLVTSGAWKSWWGQWGAATFTMRNTYYSYGLLPPPYPPFDVYSLPLFVLAVMLAVPFWHRAFVTIVDATVWSIGAFASGLEFTARWVARRTPKLECIKDEVEQDDH